MAVLCTHYTKAMFLSQVGCRNQIVSPEIFSVVFLVFFFSFFHPPLYFLNQKKTDKTESKLLKNH